MTSALLSRSSVRYLAAIGLSQVANVCVILGVIFTMNEDADIQALTGVVIAARSIGTLVGLPAGGVSIDRLNVPVPLLYGMSGVMTSALVIALVSSVSPVVLVAVSIASGFTEGVQGPAAAKGLLALASGSTRVQLNGVNASVGGAVRIAAPALAGIFVTWIAVQSPIVLAAGLYFMAAALFPRVRPNSVVAPRPPRTFRRGANLLLACSELVRFGRGSPWLVAYWLQTTLFQAAVWAPYGLLGPVVSQRVHGSALGWSTIAASYGIGVLLTGVLCARFPPRRRKLAMVIGSCAWASPVFALGIGAPLAVAGFAGACAGAANAVVGSTWASTLQESVPEERYGRVVAATTLGPALGAPIGSAVAGVSAGGDEAGQFLFLSAVVALLLPLLLLPFRWGAVECRSQTTRTFGGCA